MQLFVNFFLIHITFSIMFLFQKLLTRWTRTSTIVKLLLDVELMWQTILSLQVSSQFLLYHC